MLRLKLEQKEQQNKTVGEDEKQEDVKKGESNTGEKDEINEGDKKITNEEKGAEEEEEVVISYDYQSMKSKPDLVKIELEDDLLHLQYPNHAMSHNAVCDSSNTV